MGGFSDMLDKEKRSLHWNSQRGDKNSNVILAIVAHQRAGGRVVVGVRAGVSGKDFKKLGEVSRITDVQESKLLLNNGDVVIIESGGARVHRQIMPSCLDAGLKAGIGLSTANYPMREKEGGQKWRLCSCCYITPSCNLHFNELHEDAVAAYTAGPISKPASIAKRHSLKLKPGRRGRKKVKAEEEDGEEAASVGTDTRPTKRLRFKQEPTEMVAVKAELVPVKAEPPSEPKAAAKHAGGVSVKLEPIDLEEIKEPEPEEPIAIDAD